MSRAQGTLEARTPDGRIHRAGYIRSGKAKKPNGAFDLRFSENVDRKRERLATTDSNEAALLLHKREAQLAAVEPAAVLAKAAPIDSTTTGDLTEFIATESERVYRRWGAHGSLTRRMTVALWTVPLTIAMPTSGPACSAYLLL